MGVALSFLLFSVLFPCWIAYSIHVLGSVFFWSCLCGVLYASDILIGPLSEFREVLFSDFVENIVSTFNLDFFSFFHI